MSDYRGLKGNWREEVLFELEQAVESYRFAQLQMRACDQKLEGYIKSVPTRVIENPVPPPDPKIDLIAKPKRTRKQGNTPELNLKEELKRMCGVDLNSIDGIDVMTAQTVIAEIGTDMSRFRNENAFAAWLGLTPSRDVSGGRVIRMVWRNVQNRAATALRMAASTLIRSKSYLGARYRHLQKRLPSKPAAVKAMARYLAVLIYRLLTKGHAWVDRGAAAFEQRRTELELTTLKSKAFANGYALIPIAETR